jgi:predicted MFS family arabinose efflux permease
MLFRQPEFLKLWAGQTISLVGSQVTQLALGLTAAAILQATPAEMGILGTLASVPYLLFGLVAGVWVDRLRRRPMLIISDVGRAVLLASVPIAALSGHLNLLHLDVVAFGVGTLNVFFAVAYGSFLPSLVAREKLAEGNARLALSEAVSRTVGPGLAGVLIQILTAPVAIAVDAASFVVSAVSLLWIDANESPPSATQRRSLWAEIQEGLQTVWRQPVLRSLLGALTLGNMGDGLLSGIYLLLLTRDLSLEPAAIGAVFAGLGVGGLFGAAVSGVVTHAVGPGATLYGAMVIWGLAYGAMALVQPSGLAVPVLAVLMGALGTINPIAGANSQTLRQAVTPDRLLGRVVAVGRVATWGGVAAGSFAGGQLADVFGVRPVVMFGGLLPLAGAVWLLLSPVRNIRRLDSLAGPCSNDC